MWVRAEGDVFLRERLLAAGWQQAKLLLQENLLQESKAKHGRTRGHLLS